MSPNTLSGFVLLVHLVLMVLAFVALVAQGRLIGGGLAMMAASLVPVLWQLWFTDSELPGFVMLLIFTFPPGLLALLAGLVMAVVRYWNRTADAESG